MPRTASKNRNIVDEREERAIRVEEESLWAATKRVLLDRRTRMICGLLLLVFAGLAVIAYFSYLFTGTADQSILGMDHEDQIASRLQISNLLGLPGAKLAQFMVDGSFGFVSVLLAVMIGMYGLRLMHIKKVVRCIRIFCTTVFWVLWGSTILGFAQQMTHMGVYRWGGAFGAKAAAWLTSYVQIVGTLSILGVTLAIFLIVTDPKFIDRCKAFGLWFAGLFKKKEKPIDEPSDEIDPDVRQQFMKDGNRKLKKLVGFLSNNKPCIECGSTSHTTTSCPHVEQVQSAESYGGANYMRSPYRSQGNY